MSARVINADASAKRRLVWNDHMLAALQNGYASGRPAAAIAADLGISVDAVHNKAGNIGAKHRHFTRSLAERFADYVSPEPNSGCWLWDGSVDNRGYGQLRVHHKGPGSLRYATHVALELAGRPIPQGLMACHHCDQPACVNPAHLFIGTQKDNMQDCLKKGRHSKPPPNVGGKPRKAFCYRGHPLSGENLRIKPPNLRLCRECCRIQKRNRRARLSAEGLTSRGKPFVEPRDWDPV